MNSTTLTIQDVCFDLSGRNGLNDVQTTHARLLSCQWWAMCWDLETGNGVYLCEYEYCLSLFTCTMPLCVHEREREKVHYITIIAIIRKDTCY